MKQYHYHDVDFRGTIERVIYTVTTPAGKILNKYANVYLPYGYDASDLAKRYNILYLMHGSGGNPDAWLDCCPIKNMLDHTFSTREAEPMIVVFPSFYKETISRTGKRDANYEYQNVLFFLQELICALMPAVEGRYHTYAESTSEKDLLAARGHRAFGGFSMGGATTWAVLTHCPEYFSRFVPLSGDCWEIEPLGGRSKPKETAQFLNDLIRNSAFAPEDFHIFAATGTEDAANESLTPQIEEMKQLSDVFHFSEDCACGNLHFLLANGEVHAYEAVYQYLYHYLPYLFAECRRNLS